MVEAVGEACGECADLNAAAMDGVAGHAVQAGFYAPCAKACTLSLICRIDQVWSFSYFQGLRHPGDPEP